MGLVAILLTAIFLSTDWLHAQVSVKRETRTPMEYWGYKTYESKTGRVCPSQFMAPSLNVFGYECEDRRHLSLREQANKFNAVYDESLAEAEGKFLGPVIRNQQKQTECALDALTYLDANNKTSLEEVKASREAIWNCLKVAGYSDTSFSPSVAVEQLQSTQACQKKAIDEIEKKSPFSEEVKNRQAEVLRHIYKIAPRVCQLIDQNIYNVGKMREAASAVRGIRNELRKPNNYEITCKEPEVTNNFGNLATRCPRWTSELTKYASWVRQGQQELQAHLLSVWGGGDPSMAKYISDTCDRRTMGSQAGTGNNAGTKVRAWTESEESFVKSGLDRTHPFALQTVLDDIRIRNATRKENMANIGTQVPDNLKADLVKSGAVNRYLAGMSRVERKNREDLVCHLEAETIGKDEAYFPLQAIVIGTAIGVMGAATLGGSALAGSAALWGGIAIGAVELNEFGRDCIGGIGAGSVVSSKVCESLQKAKAAGKTFPWPELKAADFKHKSACMTPELAMAVAGVLPIGEAYSIVKNSIRTAAEARAAAAAMKLRVGDEVAHAGLSAYGYTGLELEGFADDGAAIISAVKNGNRVNVPVHINDLKAASAAEAAGQGVSTNARKIAGTTKKGAVALDDRSVLIAQNEIQYGPDIYNIPGKFRFNGHQVPDAARRSPDAAIDYLRRYGNDESFVVRYYNQKSEAWEVWTGGLQAEKTASGQYVIARVNTKTSKVDSIFTSNDFRTTFDLSVARSYRSSEHQIRLLPNGAVEVNGRIVNYSEYLRRSDVEIIARIKGSEVQGTFNGISFDGRIQIGNRLYWPDEIQSVEVVEYVSLGRPRGDVRGESYLKALRDHDDQPGIREMIREANRNPRFFVD